MPGGYLLFDSQECEVCGVRFVQTRPDRKVCSDKCRKRKQRKDTLYKWRKPRRVEKDRRGTTLKAPRNRKRGLASKAK